MISKRSVVAGIVWLALAPLAQAQVYSWKDAEGRMHFSSSPPEGQALSSGQALAASPTVKAEAMCRQAWRNLRQHLPDMRRQVDESLRHDKSKRDEYERAMRQFNQWQASLSDSSAQSTCVQDYARPGVQALTDCRAKAETAQAMNQCQEALPRRGS